jgi:hypothetical protein
VPAKNRLVHWFVNAVFNLRLPSSLAGAGSRIELGRRAPQLSAARAPSLDRGWH